MTCRAQGRAKDIAAAVDNTPIFPAPQTVTNAGVGGCVFAATDYIAALFSTVTGADDVDSELWYAAIQAA